MIEVSALEGRVLGVLIEKALSTPEHYPLSLNAIVDGSNQKNNRDPVINVEESACFEAVERLRHHKLVVRVDTAGGRVSKYRQALAEVWNLNPRELSVFCELLLRGPQTLGELRGRASRMVTLDSLDMVRTVLQGLITRPQPLLKQLSAISGSRAERYAQLVYTDPRAAAVTLASENASAPSAIAVSQTLSDRVVQLESEVAALNVALRRLAQSLGEADPFA